MILYVDTAISGPWQYRQGKAAPPIPDEQQPHLVRLAWVLEGPDSRAVREACHLVRLPDGAEMDNKTAFATGIFNQLLVERAMRPRNVLAEFADVLNESSRIIAHNWQHQRHVIECSFRREGMTVPDWPPHACAMQEVTNLVQIPRKAPGGGYKWPSFDEAFEHFFGRRWQPTMHPNADGLGRVQAVRTFHHAARVAEGTA